MSAFCYAWSAPWPLEPGQPRDAQPRQGVKDLADANKPDTSMLTKLVNTDGGNFAYEQ